LRENLHEEVSKSPYARLSRLPLGIDGENIRRHRRIVLINGMVEYMTLAVLSIHRHWRTYLDQQREKSWKVHRVHPASSRRVGVLGLGVLRRAAGASVISHRLTEPGATGTAIASIHKFNWS
jgi:hypothetical protein